MTDIKHSQIAAWALYLHNSGGYSVVAVPLMPASETAGARLLGYFPHKPRKAEIRRAIATFRHRLAAIGGTQ